MRERTSLGPAIKNHERRLQAQALRLVELKSLIKELYAAYDAELDKLITNVSRSTIEGSESAGVQVGKTKQGKPIILRDNFATRNHQFRPACVRRFDVETP